MNTNWNQDSGRNINNLRYADDTTLMAESEEELKSLLVKVKEESEKASIKLIIQKTKIMASGPMGPWDFIGNRWGESDRVYLFIFQSLFFLYLFLKTLFFGGSSKITADCAWSHEIKGHVLLGRKVMTNPDSILKSRDITLPTKFCLFKAMVFPVVIYVYESWTIKKAESQRIDSFELWYWRRLLRVPWTARGSNQSIVKEISPVYSLERLILKLKLQYFSTWYKELTHLKRPRCWKDWRQEEKVMTEDEMAGWCHWLDGYEWVNSVRWWWTGSPGMLQFMGSQRVRHDWAAELNLIKEIQGRMLEGEVY